MFKKQAKIEKVISGLLFFGLVVSCFLIFVVFSPRYSIKAQDPTCIAPALANYVATVLDGLGSSCSNGICGNVRLLSPAFNMSEPGFEAMVNGFSAGLSGRGYSLSSFYAIAGNAYNMPSNTIDGWIQRARSTAIGGRRLVLTEIGFYPPNSPPGGRVAALQALASSITSLKNNSGIDAALLFNVFGRNQDPNFAGHVLSSGEISTVCGAGGCGKIGANSAVYYSSPDSFYGAAQSQGMRFTLEIGTNNIPQVTDGINRAHARGITPILRIGVGTNTGGFNSPADFVTFINGLRSTFSGTIYLIVGPNEPNAECWATSQCGCSGAVPPGGVPGQPGLPGQQVLSFDWPTDAAHFYVDESGNEELIQTITSFISLTGQGQEIAIGWNPVLPPPPPPANPGDLLNLPDYRQSDPLWGEQIIDSCVPEMRMRNYGCGPTSAAIVLRYVRGDANITPGTVNQTLPSDAIRCGRGSAYIPILQNLGANYTNISLTREAIAASVSQGRPMIIYCRSFGIGVSATDTWNRNHISALRGVSRVPVNGVDTDMLYFQDPILGRIAVSLETVVDHWNCDNPTSVW